MDPWLRSWGFFLYLQTKIFAISLQTKIFALYLQCQTRTNKSNN